MMDGFVVLIASTEANSALASFIIYTILVMLIAVFAGRLLSEKGFLSEYFLGGRGLGMWAFAMTFAATSASGGSFMGFPSLIYTYGWVLAFWIGSYMIFPLVTMAVLGKRLNQIARKTGAITVPDVISDRFDSPRLGALTTLLIVIFMSAFLVGQFKAGSLILQTLLQDVPIYQATVGGFGSWIGGIPLIGTQPAGYVLCLIVFAVAVIAYTSYGGFHAVVWTDVMQGVVMCVGVVLMFILALWQVGGLNAAAEKLEKMTPPVIHQAYVEAEEPVDEEFTIPFGTWIEQPGEESQMRRIFRVAQAAAIATGERQARPTQGGDTEGLIEVLEITTPEEIARIDVPPLEVLVQVRIAETERYAYGDGQPGVYMRGPGPSKDSAAGFLPLGLAISFFLFWPLIGLGQPGNLVRLMAFNNVRTFARATATVCIYYSAIYIPLVVIFVIARVFLPGMEIESDRIMPEMAVHLTRQAGMSWLAGIVVAAAFAAVMSTVDSFLLLISSAVVRDVYQRHVNPDASEKSLRRLTYIVTTVVGVAAVIGALNPPQYLQYIIVSAAGGMGVVLLIPIALGLYWERFNALGAAAAMLGGLVTYSALWITGFVTYAKFKPYLLFHCDPIIPALLVSLLLGVGATYLAPPTRQAVIDKLFYK